MPTRGYQEKSSNADFYLDRLLLAFCRRCEDRPASGPRGKRHAHQRERQHCDLLRRLCVLGSDRLRPSLERRIGDCGRSVSQARNVHRQNRHRWSISLSPTHRHVKPLHAKTCGAETCGAETCRTETCHAKTCHPKACIDSGPRVHRLAHVPRGAPERAEIPLGQRHRGDPLNLIRVMPAKGQGLFLHRSRLLPHRPVPRIPGRF